jgi:RimJ/RimL family protein N-acetyltransferase
MVLIRKMVKADAEAYRDLRLHALQTNPEAFGGSYEESLEQGIEFFRNRIPELDSENVIFVAEVDSQLLGMMGLVRSDRLKSKHRATVWGVFVDPALRGKGVGRRLMEAISNHARQLGGLRHVSLSVITTNTPALRLYESFGFTVWGTEPESLLVNGIYYDEYYMNLRL